jgi:hypothetical protein
MLHSLLDWKFEGEIIVAWEPPLCSEVHLCIFGGPGHQGQLLPPEDRARVRKTIPAEGLMVPALGMPTLTKVKLLMHFL